MVLRKDRDKAILDILDGKFEESVIRISPSYALPYHLSPISTSHFMEERMENLRFENSIMLSD